MLLTDPQPLRVLLVGLQGDILNGSKVQAGLIPGLV